jgi:methylphosphotriester-DNA--protein-cysteine methyltransferase
LLFIEWLDLDEIARQVNLRPYHFLLYVTKVLGLTPHQYLSRTSFRARALCFAGLQCGLSFLAWLVVLGVSPSVGLRERMR